MGGDAPRHTPYGCSPHAPLTPAAYCRDRVAQQHLHDARLDNLARLGRRHHPAVGVAVPRNRPPPFRRKLVGLLFCVGGAHGLGGVLKRGVAAVHDSLVRGWGWGGQQGVCVGGCVSLADRPLASRPLAWVSSVATSRPGSALRSSSSSRYPSCPSLSASSTSSPASGSCSASSPTCGPLPCVSTSLPSSGASSAIAWAALAALRRCTSARGAGGRVVARPACQQQGHPTHTPHLRWAAPPGGAARCRPAPPPPAALAPWRARRRAARRCLRSHESPPPQPRAAAASAGAGAAGGGPHGCCRRWWTRWRSQAAWCTQAACLPATPLPVSCATLLCQGVSRGWNGRRECKNRGEGPRHPWQTAVSTCLLRHSTQPVGYLALAHSGDEGGVLGGSSQHDARGDGPRASLAPLDQQHHHQQHE